MKMVKSLLLGSAAGVVAVAGAQAADLPVKAKAVEYVKICSLYGAGFYYIPGTNTCLGISGFVRFQTYHIDGGAGAASQSNTASLFSAPNGGDLRVGTGHSLTFRVREMITFDARTQSEYGTLRSVATIGYTNDRDSAPGGTTIYANRGFIQIAGFTLGKATSYFDFYSAPASAYIATATGDTGDGGWIVAAYTAQFGGGMSATIAAEEPRRTQIVNTSAAAFTITTTGGIVYTNSYVQQRAPDVVANLRMDQAWGSFQIMGAIHDVGSGYNVPTAIGSGHPSDKIGWAGAAGLRLRLGGDVLDTQFTYSEGASRYHIHAQATTSLYQFSSNQVAGTVGDFGGGIISDGVFAGGAAAPSIDLTTMWSVNASYDHRWSPKLKTSIYGSYLSTSYNATANANICAAYAGAGFGLTSCDSNWKLWYIGSRTQWDVTKGLYMGIDVLYQKLETSNDGATGVFVPAAGRPSGTYTFTDQENWTVSFRAHRDFP
jgi:hypothetical protein